MYSRDTIAAIATPPGAGGIAVVRVSGPDAAAIASRVFRGLPRGGPESHRLYPGSVVTRDGSVIDRGLCVMMRAPRSYTGEDVLELHCHGGPLVTRSVLATALAAGARAAERGEFTLRAFLNGKLDLAQAESVLDLISARTPAALRVATAQLQGELSRAVEAIRQEVVGIAARLEVAIDFSEDDVGELDREALASAATVSGERIRALAATFAHGRVLREGARVVIAGKPNVGKSSLLNRLLAAERAIVTPIPGTTRDVIEETADVGGIPVALVDTAGVRPNPGEVERIGIERARMEIATADLTLIVLDGSKPLGVEDQAVFDAAQQNKRIILINKIDLGRVLDTSRVSVVAPGVPIVETSVTRGLGLDALREAIVQSLDVAHTDGFVVVTRERHHVALLRAAAALDALVESLWSAHPPDVVAVSAMDALDHLGEIVGRTSPEAVLDRVFSEFCIGK